MSSSDMLYALRNALDGLPYEILDMIVEYVSLLLLFQIVVF